MLVTGVAFAGVLEGARALGVLARPGCDHRVHGRALARSGRASSGQCRARMG
jgi:hypothetical protein